MIWMTSADGIIEYCNAEWFRYTGMTPEETYGKHLTWISLVHPEDAQEARAVAERAIAEGVPFELEYRLYSTPVRDYRWFLATSFPLRDESGAVIKRFGIATEIDDQRRALERKQQIVDTLQQALIPKVLPAGAGLTFDALYVPADSESRVGGDWYDAFELADGNFAFSVGDVAGHGLEAAVSMGQVRQAIVAAAFDRPDPGVVLERVNRILYYQHQTMATAVLGFIYPRAQRIVYASAGHPAPIFAERGKAAQLLKAPGIPLGIELGDRYESYTINIERGGILLAYTDGVLEFDRDIPGAEAALVAAVSEAAAGEHPSVKAIRERVMGTMSSRDDIAMLLIRFEGAGKGRG